MLSLFSGRVQVKAAVESKRGERERLITAAEVTAVTAEHEQFLKVGAHEIVSRIEKGDWTARQVTEAYIAQAIEAHRATNCLTEVLFDQALKRAEELDAQFALTKKLVGPFHGVPFSAKPAKTNAVLVNQLISLGAIPIAKTNVPQTMFSFECKNPLWGRTSNPYNTKYSCGGSSGGEAALLAMDGAAFGIGSDIGGSLRIPAGYCGIYALKTSFGRISKGGARSSNPGFEGIKVVAGPMTRNVKDIEIFCKAIFGFPDDTQSDYTFVPMPYREPVLPKRLKFGYYTSDGYVKASPANRRAVLETIEALKDQGHECVEIELPDPTEALKIFLALMSADGYKRLTAPLGPDPMDPSLFLPIWGARVPNFIRSFGAWVVERILGDSLFAKFIRVSRIKSVGETNVWLEERNKWNAMFYEKVWNRYGLDGIVCPVQAIPQIPHGGATEVNSLVISTALYNLVDSPIGIVPVTHVDADKDKLTKEWIAPTDTKRSVLMEQRVYQSNNPVYNPVEMDGMPVSVQVVGRKWEDEKVVAMMSIVDEALGTGRDRGFGPRACVGHVDD